MDHTIHIQLATETIESLATFQKFCDKCLLLLLLLLVVVVVVVLLLTCSSMVLVSMRGSRAL
jgi:hypothetical protein